MSLVRLVLSLDTSRLSSDIHPEFDKNGEHAELKFPEFHQAMLSQSWWNAGEALGRVKVVLAEGLARENRHPPFERIKNIVAFSFQHVPLGTRISFASSLYLVMLT